MIRRVVRKVCVLAVVPAGLWLPTVAHADTHVWNGGGADNNWGTILNWDIGAAPVAADALQFGGTTQLDPNNNLAAATSFASITFNSGAGAFVIGGNSITLTGALTNNDDDLQTINNNLIVAGVRTVNTASGNITLGGTISGGGAFSKTGSGYTLTLTGSNSFTNQTTISAGTLCMTSATGCGTSLITVNGGGPGSTFQFLNNGSGSDGTINIANTLQQNVGNTGTVHVGNNGSNTGNTVVFASMNQSTTTINFTGANGYKIQITAYDLFGGATGTSVINPTTTDLTIGTIGNSTVNAHTAQLDGTASGCVVTGVISDGSSSVAVTKANTSTWTLSGANTYSGITTVSAGTLNINHATATGSGQLRLNGGTIDNTSAGDITLSNNNTMSWGGDFSYTGGTRSLNLGTGAVTLTANRQVTVGGNTLTVGGAITGSYSLTKAGAGTLALSSTGNAWTGTTTVSAGTLGLGASGVIPDGSGRGNVSLAGTIDLAGYSETVNGLSGAGTVTTSSGTPTLTIGNNDQTSSFSGSITDGSGSVALTKTGSGTITLSGVNTFTGTTAVNGGTLLITGSTAASAVTVNSAATLGGNGTVGGAITMNAGSSLAPGTGGTTIGTLSTAGVTMNASSTYLVDLDGAGPTYDQINSSGSVVCAGALTVTSVANGAVGKVYIIINAATAVTGTFGSLPDGTQFSGGGRTFQIAYTGTQVTLTEVTHTATRVWDGGGGGDNWGTAANWNLDQVPFMGDDLQFAGATRLTPTNDFAAWTSFSSLTFNAGAGAFVVGGNGVTLAGNITNNDGDIQTINLDLSLAATRTVNAASGTIVLGGVISGVGGLTKSGGRALTLSGANTYSGTSTLSAGTLNINSATAIGSGLFTISGGTFDNTSAGDLTLSNNNVQSWAGNFTYAGGTRSLNMGTGTVALTANRTVTVNGGTLTIGGVVSGAYTLDKAGAGTLLFTGANLYSGQTTITAGTLATTNTSGLGTGTIAMNNGTYKVMHNGSGSNGTINISNTLLINSTYVGTIHVGNNGSNTGNTVVFPSINNGVSTFNVTGANGYQVQITSYGLGGGVDGTSVINPTSANLIMGTLSSTSGNAHVAELGGTATGCAITGVISNGASVLPVTKVGTGTWTLSGANTYTGGTTISAGTLNINSTTALGTGLVTINGGTIDNTSAGTITLSNNNTQSWGGDFTYTGGTRSLNMGTGAVALTGNRIVTVGGSTLTVGGAVTGSYSLTKAGAGTLALSSTGNAWTGTTTVSAGTLRLGAAGVIPDGAGTGNVSLAGTLDLNGASEGINGLSGAGTVTTSSGTPTLTVGNNDQTAAFGGSLVNGSGTLALTKTGTGTLTLTGTASTYSGATTVSAGTLMVTNASGSATGTGAVNVSGGGTLAGTGTVSGLVTIADGGTIKPGNSNSATLTLGSGLALNSSSSLAFDIGTSSDQIAVTGDLTLNGIIDISQAVGFGTGTYTIITYSGNLIDNGLAVGTVPAGLGITASIDVSTAHEVRLVLTVTVGTAWSQTGLGTINGGAIGETKIFLGTTTPNAIIGRNLTDGSSAWSYTSGITSGCRTPTYTYLSGSYVLVAASGSDVVGVNDDGTTHFAATAIGGVAGTPYISPDNTNFFVTRPGFLSKRLLSSGSQVAGWDVAVTNISTAADIVVESDFVYVATTSGKVHKGDAADFTPLSTYEPASLAGVSINLPLMISGNTLYITPNNNTLHAVSTLAMTATKSLVTFSNGSANSGPAWSEIDLTGDTVYTAAGNFAYMIKDAAGGVEKWSFDAGGAINSGPVVWGNTVYFGRNGGYYYALNKADRSLRTYWPYTSAGGNATSGPWIDVINSHVIFGTTGGNLDAFALEP